MEAASSAMMAIARTVIAVFRVVRVQPAAMAISGIPTVAARRATMGMAITLIAAQMGSRAPV